MALRLDFPTEARWLDGLPGGVRLRVEPVTHPVYLAAQEMARRSLAAALRETADGAEADGPPDRSPDRPPDLPPGLTLSAADRARLDDPDARRGIAEDLLVRALARLTVRDWQGVLDADGGSPAPCTPERLDVLMHGYWPVADAFFARIMAPLDALVAEGNACTAAPDGTGAADETTAPAAVTAAPLAPTGCPA